MKKMVWSFYGALIIFFALLGLGVAISTGNSLVFTFINSAFTVLYFGTVWVCIPQSYMETIWLEVPLLAERCVYRSAFTFDVILANH
ncbi:hypothetical protein [Pseudomonas sp. B392_1p]|uniref:hypothetical protein n=1 Tax=Pseudomonas sp. B392_1p TaxID=3457507 RepID=UPI003FD6607E